MTAPFSLVPPEIVQRPLPDSHGRMVPVNGAIVHAEAEYVKSAGEAIYAPDFLKQQKLSVHAMVTPDGRVLSCVGTERVAYHAGASSFKGQNNLNSTFLGCEFLVAGDHDYPSFLEAIAQPNAYTPDQYRAGGWLYAQWMGLFPAITKDRIVAHSAVSGDDVRGPGEGKRDPGAGFDWDQFWGWVDRWSGAPSVES